MKKAFIETSAINAFFRYGMTGQQLRVFLEKQNLSPVVGIFTTFELAKTFLCDNASALQTVKGLFQLIRELNPEYSCRDDHLFTMESNKLKFNHDINPLVTSKEILAEINSRTNRFCDGNVSDIEKIFLQEKEKNFIQCRLLWGRQSFNRKISEFKKFSEYRDSFLKNYDLDFIKNFLKKTAEIRIPDVYVRRLITNINSYPALRVLIYFHLYLNFYFRHDPPAKERMADAVQLMEASYFSIFISGDERHKRYAHEINPDIEFITTNSLGIS